MCVVCYITVRGQWRPALLAYCFWMRMIFLPAALTSFSSPSPSASFCIRSQKRILMKSFPINVAVRHAHTSLRYWKLSIKQGSWQLNISMGGAVFLMDHPEYSHGSPGTQTQMFFSLGPLSLPCPCITVALLFIVCFSMQVFPCYPPPYPCLSVFFQPLLPLWY